MIPPGFICVPVPCDGVAYINVSRISYYLPDNDDSTAIYMPDENVIYTMLSCEEVGKRIAEAV